MIYDEWPLVLHLNHDLAEMSSACQELERLFGLFEGEYPVDNGVNLVLLVELHHLLEAVLGTVDDSLDRQVLAQCEHIHVESVVRILLLPGCVADAIDQSTKGDAIKGLAQGLRAAGFEDDVCAVVVRHPHHFLVPVGVRAVVDGIVGSELLRLLQLLVG